MKKSLLIYALLIILFASCSDENDKIETNDINFRQEMRDFVIAISYYSKGINPGFIVIPQNGIELVSTTGNEDGQPHLEYLNAIDGNGQEDLFYGYDDDNVKTPVDESQYLTDLLQISASKGKTILVTDYCSTPSKMDDSYNLNNAQGFISLAADHRELDNIPQYPVPVNNENSLIISNLSQAKNFLYLINPGNFNTKTEFINAVTNTNYDLLIMDLYFNDGNIFSSSEIDELKNKHNGGKRLVICYMSIGEAEDYRYYWDNDWNNNKPTWLDEENPEWKGNYKVKYWQTEWKDIIFGNNESYLKKILDAGFNGVYLDIIDAYEYFEN